jgi:hypothetical protein
MSDSKTVTQLTSYLRGLARRRKNSIVTADDVQNFLTRKNFTASQNERLSITRTVLQEPTFLPVGMVASKRGVARGRRVTAWTI